MYGPATFINTAVGQIQDELAKKQQTAADAGAAGRRGRAQALEAARRSALGAAAPCEGRRRCGPGAVHQRNAPARAQVRAQRHPANQRPDLRVRARVRPDRRRAGRAEVALRLPVPLEERGADPDPPAAGPDRGRAGARDRPDSGGDRGEGLQAPQGRALHRHRRAGGGGGARRRRAALDLHPARSGAAADGGHAGARVPLAPAAAAAGARARRGGHDLRRAVARRRQPHDGVDRGAARADRPGGGLRDPVPGPLRRGRGARRPRAGGGGRGRGRPDDHHGRPRHGDRIPGAAAVPGADGARLRPAAGARHRARARLRALRRLRCARALPWRPPRARAAADLVASASRGV